MQTLIENFEKEAEKSGTHKIICEHVTGKIYHAAEDVIKNIKDNKLTITGAIDAMKAEAQKNQSGGCGVLSDKEGYRVVDEYFGFTKESAETVQKPVSLFDIM